MAGVPPRTRTVRGQGVCTSQRKAAPPRTPSAEYGTFYACMLSELEVLHDVCARLEKAGIPYMLTGSMAMNVYAQPRIRLRELRA